MGGAAGLCGAGGKPRSFIAAGGTGACGAVTDGRFPDPGIGAAALCALGGMEGFACGGTGGCGAVGIFT